MDYISAMSVDELWQLHERISAELIRRLEIETGKIDERLAALHGQSGGLPKRRQSYPKMAPKFQNPAEPSQTWSGRGRRPPWVTEALKAGKSLDDLLIAKAATIIRPLSREGKLKILAWL